MKLLASLAPLLVSAQNKCVQCTWSKDITTGEGISQEGNDVGKTRDPECFNDKAKNELITECPNDGLLGKQYCFNEASFEWRPNGQQIVTITRGCRRQEWADRCDPSSESGYQRTDCHVTVDANGDFATNDGTLDELWKLTNADQDNIKKCKSCNAYGTIENGEETGDQDFENCRHGTGNDEVTCEPYATRACFSVETVSKDLSPLPGSDPAEVSYRRGCSHFEVDESQQKCNNYLDGFKNAEACKDSCTEKDSCNDQEIEVPQNCYVCEYSWDLQGTIGVGDQRCRSGVSGKILKQKPLFSSFKVQS